MNMDDHRRTKISKYVSLLLRHRPGKVGLVLDAAGWVGVDDLLARSSAEGMRFTRAELDEVVARCPKRRFAVSPDGSKIRASQGHSVPVELGYEPATPPALLYHGTYEAVAGLIRAEGLKRMNRHHVHLSADAETARAVGSRRGRPVIFAVDAARMAADGHAFFVAENGVWLTDAVPPEYLSDAFAT